MYQDLSHRLWPTDSLRVGNWKIVSLSSSQPYQLFDLAMDIGETNDLSSLYPDIVEQLAAIARAAHTDNPYFPVGDSVCVSS